MLRPIGNRVLVRPIANKEETNSGLYVPSAKTTFQRGGAHNNKQVTVGEVLAVGTVDTKYGKRPVDVKIGSYVTFSDSCGQQVEHDDEKYVFIREDDIVGYIPEPTNIELMN